mgnify:CR=1 FL=1
MAHATEFLFAIKKNNLRFKEVPATVTYTVYSKSCLLYTSDAADERSSVDLGGRRIIKKKNNAEIMWHGLYTHTKYQKLAKKRY